MKLFITVDTEEDLWGGFRREGIPVENISLIPRLQEIFDRHGAVPTYLVDWPVAADERAVRTLREILDRRGCEIGTHCHPWNTPPFEEEASPRYSMLSNLPAPLVERKLGELHELLVSRFGVEPRCFRAGRWGMNADVARIIARLGYQVDTSVTPFHDWSSKHGPDYSCSPIGPYRFEPESFPSASPRGSMLEVPATTGFLQRDFARSAAIRSRLMRPPFSRLRVVGALNRLGLLSMRELSPETSSAADMERLSRIIQGKGHGALNCHFHSSNLLPGATPFVKSRGQLETFFGRIDHYLGFAAGEGYEFAPLSRALEVER